VPQANGLIVLSGAHFGDIGRPSKTATGAGRRTPRSAGRPSSPAISISRSSAPASQPGAAGAPLGGAGGQAGPAGGGHASGAVHQPDEYIAHEARTCIAEGEMLANAKRVRRFNEQMCFKSQAEMAELFRDLPARCKTRWRSPSAAT
jgi:DNA polymerase-3 subunit alpha